VLKEYLDRVHLQVYWVQQAQRDSEAQVFWEGLGLQLVVLALDHLQHGFIQ
jgi:hypothetical protein